MMSDTERDASRRMLAEFARLREIAEHAVRGGQPIPPDVDFALSELDRLLNHALSREVVVQ